jgi:hypothetical protein
MLLMVMVMKNEVPFSPQISFKKYLEKIQFFITNTTTANKHDVKYLIKSVLPLYTMEKNICPSFTSQIIGMFYYDKDGVTHFWV